MTSCLVPRLHDVVEATDDVSEAKHDVVQAKHDVVQAKHDVSSKQSTSSKHDVGRLMLIASFCEKLFSFLRPLQEEP